MQYLVRAKSVKQAFDCINLEGAEEVCQVHLGETIFGGRVITMKEAKRLHQSEESSCAGAPLEKIIHEIDYKNESV